MEGGLILFPLAFYKCFLSPAPSSALIFIYFPDDDSYSNQSELETLLMTEEKDVYNKDSKPLEKESKEYIRLWKLVHGLAQLIL